jgi:hypothetical protein
VQPAKTLIVITINKARIVTDILVEFENAQDEYEDEK